MKQSTEVLTDKLLAERDARRDAELATLTVEQERDALRKTIEDLQARSGPARDAALKALEDGDTSKAEELFLTLAAEREQAGADANHEAAEAWRHIGALAFLHDTQKALRAFARATELDPDNAVGWNQLAALQVRLGDLETAEASFNKVLALGNSNADKTLIAAATGNLGVIYLIRGDLDKAEEFLLKALNLNEELGRKEGMADAYCNLGIIYFTRGDLDKAEKFQLKALTLNDELGRKEGMAYQYGNLGNIYFTQGEHDKAEKMYLKTLDLDKDLGSKEGKARSYANLGNVHQTRGDMPEACKYWRKSLDLYTDIGTPRVIEIVEGWMKDAGCSTRLH